MTASWQFISWNLDYWRSKPQLRAPADILAERGPAVIALQEVHGERARALQQAFPISVFSQEIHSGANWGWSGCALLFPPRTVILKKGVVLDLPKPQRSVWVTAQLPGREPLTFVSWHTPNASGDGVEVKAAAYRVMSDWLRDHPLPLALGADLNTWRDPIDLLPAHPADDFFEEHAFVGPQPRHGLLDAYRDVLMRSGRLDELRQTKPEGPLGISHVLRKSGQPHRMDRIFVSPDLTPVVDAGYLGDEGMEGGSDHALHWAEFT